LVNVVVSISVIPFGTAVSIITAVDIDATIPNNEIRYTLQGKRNLNPNTVHECSTYM